MAMPRLPDLVNKMIFRGVWQPVQSKLQVFQNFFGSVTRIAPCFINQ